MVVTVSSGAALRGSPLSGGYAGAKAAIRFLTSYAADESKRNDLAIRFTSVLPRMTPATDLGEAAVAAYAQRAGVDVGTFLEQSGPALTAEKVGDAIVSLVTDPSYTADAYRLAAGGLAAVE